LTSTTPVAETVVATVAGRPILLEHIEHRILELRSGPRGRQMPQRDGPGYLDLCRWVLRELVTEALVANEARLRGIAEAEVADAVTADVEVPDDELRAYYLRNEDLFRRAEVRTVDWADGGRMDIRRGELVGPFEETVFAARAGEAVGRLPGIRSHHAARVASIEPESTLPFEEARPSIERELLSAARLHAFDAWLERRRRGLVLVEPVWEHPAHPAHGFPSHRH
jgi:hypothetical protein